MPVGESSVECTGLTPNRGPLALSSRPGKSASFSTRKEIKTENLNLFYASLIGDWNVVTGRYGRRLMWMDGEELCEFEKLIPRLEEYFKLCSQGNQPNPHHEDD
ncbi:hypothetical protein, conserved [Eimeria necatrix]|uniref:Uncharacterized protein n=1 Tax=Eimeria necatrix TaxID=51315 RepID=U6MRX5_9EIME|nr:hypothetical protein, conserved [Eimeria necatrix]CDJ65843.1 hypothetical protein, conserved [Eimeria necatrix]